MNLYFADRSLNILGMASTAMNAVYAITDDTYKEDIQTGLATLEFTMHYAQNGDTQAFEMTAEGNVILYDGVQGQRSFSILEIERDPVQRQFYIYAEDAGINLINSIVPAFALPSEERGITYYIETAHLLPDDFSIGINESLSTRRISFDGESTGTERLAAIADAFDVETRFRFEFSGLTITRKYLDIFNKRGKDIQMELRLGRELENIIEKRSVANLATALWCEGSPSEVNGEQGDPITLYDYHYDDTENDGDFHTEQASYLLESRTALNKWGRRKGASENGYGLEHIVRYFNYDTTDKVELYNRGREALMKMREPEVTYQVSLLYLPEDLSLGDTVNLVDDYSGLYVEARLLKIEVSETNDTRTAEFGDYDVKTAGIDTNLFSQARYRTSPDRYTWVVYADTENGGGISKAPYSTTGTKKKYMGIASNKLSSEPILDPTLYIWTRIDDDNIVDVMDFNDYVEFNPTFEVYTDPATGETYYVDLATGNKYLVYEDDNGTYYINPETDRKTYFTEGVLWEMTEEEEAEYRAQWNLYKQNTINGQGVYYIHNDNGTTTVKIISDQIDTNGLNINGTSLADYISSHVGYRVVNYTATYNIASEGIVNLTASQLGISTPDGFTPVAVLSARSGHGNVVVRTFNGAAIGSTQALCLKNVAETAYSDLEANLSILYISTNLSGEGGGGGGGGGVGTLNYNDLLNKPQIDEVTLQGNRDLYITNTEIDNIINFNVSGV